MSESRAKKQRNNAPSSLSHPYGFPFPPYGCQAELMRELYECLDDGGIGVFESPTGTGKSLSLICGALRWQLDQQKREEERLLAEQTAQPADDDELSWMTEWASAKELAQVQARSSSALEAREKRAKRLERYLAGARRADARGARAVPLAAAHVPSVAGKADDFTLAEWEEPDREIGGGAKPALILDDCSSIASEGADGGTSRPWRVFYCSRTHSQLAQVVGEVKKTRYGEHISVVSLGSRKTLCTNEAVRSLAGSERVSEACLDLQGKKSKDGKETGMEDGGKAKGGCPYHRPGSEEQKEARQAFSDRLLLEPLDLEDLGALGRREQCCAYYAARGALPDAQLVLLPYASLLHAGTREALGISLDRSVVIIDEAHNLVDTINETHSVTLTARQLSEVSAQLAQYAEKYHARLHPANRLCVQQLLQVVRALRASLLSPQPAMSSAVGAPSAACGAPSAACGAGATDQPTGRTAGSTPATGSSSGGGVSCSDRIVAMNEFLCGLKVDHLNLFRLQAFCEGSQIAKKLRGFADSQVQAVVQSGRPDAAAGREPASGCLHGVLRLLEALTNEDKDGRVLLHIEPPTSAGPSAIPRSSDRGHGTSRGGSCKGDAGGGGAVAVSWLKVLHLNPAVYFSRVLSDAHAVVLAGGTMQPFSDLQQQLFHQQAPGRVRMRSYRHIVPPDNILPLALCAGPTGVPLHFTFGSRASPALMDELGRLVVAVAAAVPDGIVVFLPSFGYEEQLVAHWVAHGTWARLQSLKRLFREPREAAELDGVLKDYAQTIEANYGGGDGGGDGGGGGEHLSRPRGALLLSVVGGKMSEGINFSDGLGRCVLLVGLPFANASELALQERMAHLEATQGKGAGREYYTNLCFKAVNQSIGRAIRHIGDYATILLADARYAKASTHGRLPRWIGEQLRTPTSFADALANHVGPFFAARASNQARLEDGRRLRLQAQAKAH